VNNPIKSKQQEHRCRVSNWRWLAHDGTAISFDETLVAMNGNVPWYHWSNASRPSYSMLCAGNTERKWVNNTNTLIINWKRMASLKNKLQTGKKRLLWGNSSGAFHLCWFCIDDQRTADKKRKNYEPKGEVQRDIENQLPFDRFSNGSEVDERYDVREGIAWIQQNSRLE